MKDNKVRLWLESLEGRNAPAVVAGLQNALSHAAEAAQSRLAAVGEAHQTRDTGGDTGGVPGAAGLANALEHAAPQAQDRLEAVLQAHQDRVEALDAIFSQG